MIGSKPDEVLFAAVGEHGLSRGNLILRAHPGPPIFTIRDPFRNQKRPRSSRLFASNRFVTASAFLVIDLQRVELDTSHGEKSESYSG